MKVAVIGIGTAGLQTLAYFMNTLDDDIEVYSIHDPEQKILGIGESTTTFLPHILAQACDFRMLDDGPALDATTKHGVKYKNWRKKDFHNQFIPPYHAIHFNNFKLSELVLGRLRNKKGFFEIHGAIESIKQTDTHVDLLIDGTEHKFDYIIDCMGYPDDYSDYELKEDLPVNHAIVNGIDKPGNWNYTYHQATRNGWMFGIPLETRQGWGYLFNDTITSVEEAKEDMQTLFDDPIQVREFSWKNYYKRNTIDGRIISNGNRALFFEPLEALSGSYYEAVAIEAANVIMGDSTAEVSNASLRHTAEVYCAFIYFVYHGGSTFNSEFWKITVDKTTKALHNNEVFQNVKSMMQTLKTNGVDDPRIIFKPLSMELWSLVDKKMGYNYF
tara:strand:+ start:267 stop:1424 length:1158 start_codon:yes stop_codon:yes gene_type:complete